MFEPKVYRNGIARPIGEKSKLWKKRQFCNKSCSATFTGRGQKKTLGKHWKNSHVRSDKGKKLSKELRDKIVSKMTTENCRKGGLASRKILSLRNPTSIEKIVASVLDGLGIKYIAQKRINNKFLVDFYIPSKNLIIEADGEYWHNLPKTIKKDRAENAYLIACGYNLLRLTEEEINNKTFIERIN